MNNFSKYIKFLRFSKILNINQSFYCSKSLLPKSRRKLMIVIGCTGFSFFIYGLAQYKNRQAEESYKLIFDIIDSSNNSYGDPDIGGDFQLVDHKGVQRTRVDFKNKWLLVYFGYCHCPDICPEQLEKMSLIVDKIDNNSNVPNIIPIFVSVDPDRDTPNSVAKYIKEFSTKMIGLTGDPHEIKNITQSYKVFYKAGIKDEYGDYLVDHAIIMYLIGPQGDFLQYYGSAKSIDEIYASIVSEMRNYNVLV